MELTEDTPPFKASPIEDADKNVKLKIVDELLDEIIPSSPPQPPPSNHRYRTRSSMNATNDTQIRTRPVREKAAPVPPRPKPSFIKYKGKVEYQTELHDIAHQSHQLL